MPASKLSPNLDRSYRDTRYEVDHPEGRFVIAVGERNDRLDELLKQHAQNSWAYLTACNPRSRRLGQEQNQSRQVELRNYLDSMRFPVFQGRGVPSTSAWPAEDSFLVLGISREQAARIGIMVEQNAILVGEVGEAALLVYLELPERRADAGGAPDVEGYVEEHIESLWANAEITGIWIRETDIPDLIDGEPPYPPGVEILEGKLSDDRLGLLRAGAGLGADEVPLWRQAWTEWALSDEGDADSVPGYAISKVSLPEGQFAYALIVGTGYSLTELRYEVEGVFPTIEAARAHIASMGWHI